MSRRVRIIVLGVVLAAVACAVVVGVRASRKLDAFNTQVMDFERLSTIRHEVEFQRETHGVLPTAQQLEARFGADWIDGHGQPFRFERWSDEAGEHYMLIAVGSDGRVDDNAAAYYSIPSREVAGHGWVDQVWMDGQPLQSAK